MDIYVSQFLVFIMLFVRITSLIVVAPVLGHLSIPVQIKVGMGLFLSFIMFPMTAGQAPYIGADLLSVALYALKEAGVGLLMGFAVSLIFAGVRYAGELISFDTGLSMANAFDPENNQQTALVGEFMYLTALMVFLLLNGHHFVLEALYLSYSAIPIGGLSIGEPLFQKMVELSALVFVIAVKLAVPVIVSLFLTNIALSILSRVMPQMNIFVLGFPLKIGLGFVVLVASAPLFVFVFKKLLGTFEKNILELVKVL